MCPLQTAANDALAWAPYEPNENAPWNLERVVHLHRRAGFSAPWAQLQRDLSDGPQPSIDRMLRGQVSDSSAGFEAMAATIGDAAMASGSQGRLQAWWVYRMLLTPDPLGERLTLMWHNHFATSNRKVQDLVRMREQNDLLRAHSRGPFGELLSAVVKHPAMLIWLDADSNRRGHPNENLARETMELFTMGIGNYTERDVQEAARALTGWSIVNNRFAFVAARHDDGDKTVLEQTGRFSGDDFLQAAAQHPATSRRIAWRLCQTFMGEHVVDDTALSQLAAGLVARNLDVAWAVEIMLRSQLFYSPQNMRSRVSCPAEYVVGALRALELCDPPPSTLLLAEWTTRMGQELFYPPNVGGWNEGRTWLASRTIVARANFASALVQGKLWHPPQVPSIEELLARHDQPTQFDPATDWMARLLWGVELTPGVRQTIRSDQGLTKDQPLSTALALLLARPEQHLA
jgi:hypothetical protein